VSNFVKIGQYIADIEIFRFFEMTAVHYRGFVLGTFGPLTESTCRSVTVQNLVMIDAVVSII